MQAHPAGAGLPLGSGAMATQAGDLVPVLAAVGRAEQGRVLHAGIDGVRVGQEGSMCQTRLNSQGFWVPSYHWCVVSGAAVS